MTVTISKATLSRSRFGERFLIAPGRLDTPLVKVELPESEARSWRITLGRAERNDGRGPLVNASIPNNSSPLFASQIYSYAAGFQNTPASPPFRDGPVGRGGEDVDPLFVEVAWGQGSGGIHRMLGHWPMQGASIAVYGSYVEVMAGTFLAYNPGTSQEDMPVLQASVVPADGLSVEDAGELSLQQTEPIVVGYAAAGDPAVVYVPDYARRVLVILRDQTTGRVFDTGHPRCHLEWFNDLGTNVEADMQGSSIGVPPQWFAVPAQATLLRIGTPGPDLDCGETAFSACQASIHWRVAP